MRMAVHVHSTGMSEKYTSSSNCAVSDVVWALNGTLRVTQRTRVAAVPLAVAKTAYMVRVKGIAACCTVAPVAPKAPMVTDIASRKANGPLVMGVGCLSVSVSVHRFHCCPASPLKRMEVVLTGNVRSAVVSLGSY